MQALAVGRLPAVDLAPEASLDDLPPPALRSLGVLRAIALYKFTKSVFVLVTGLGLLSFYEPAFMTRLYGMVGSLPYVFEQQLLREAIGFISGLSPARIQIIAMATFAYSGLFLVEGYGLWRGRHWAELLTVLATSSLIPLETYEVWRHASMNRILVLLGNVAILAYLIWRLRQERKLRPRIVAPGR